MDILLANKFFFEKGGTERYFFSLTRALEERGHEVIHFSMRHADNFETPYARYFVEGKSYHDSLSLWEAISQGASFIRSKEAARKMASLVADHRPQVAHFHNIYHQITPSVIPVLVQAGIPIVMTLHDYKLICPNYSLFARGAYCGRCIGGKFYRAPLVRCNGGSFVRSALLSCEAYWQKWTGVYDSVRLFLAPSRFIRERFIEAGFEPERIMYLPAFIPDEDAVWREVHGTDRISQLPEKYILYFGRLSEEKGLFILLDAVRKCEGVSLVVAGEGPQCDGLKRYSEENNLRVHFTGYMEKPVLEGFIKGARAVVLPSLSPENAPFTVLEAASLGVPVIVSNMGGLPEMAERVGGMVFPSGDSEALADKIHQVWSDDVLAERMGEDAATGTRTHYQKEAHIEALEAVYRRVLEKS